VSEVKATAGLRGAHWSAADLPAGLLTTNCALPTHDEAVVVGALYALGGERTAVFIMHPREFVATHYLAPAIVAGGAAAWVQAPRVIGNDLRLEHEVALLDVAAGVRYLRAIGFERIVFLGNSGGAGLLAFYIAQSAKPGAQRLSTTPAGRPVALPEADMPAVDGLILVSPHPGQGQLLMRSIDPSVTDEADPLSIDPALFPFATANGFKKPPESSSYSLDFVQRYEAAQVRRVLRIDEKAKSLIAEKQDAKRQAKSTPSQMARMQAALATPMQVWRTDADLRCFDLSLDPSQRIVGTLWGRDPVASNLGSVGFARFCTPESWLSTWSGLTSNASLYKCLPDCDLPTLTIAYGGDPCVFPTDIDAILSVLRSSDAERQSLPGNHHGHPVIEGAEGGRDAAGQRIQEWLRARFPMRGRGSRTP
jgi:pimeloyl-ACP methyl ester carboxylesterase